MRLPIAIVMLVLLITGASLLLLGERTGTQRTQGVDMAAEIEAIMQADRDFDQATAERGADGWVSFFAADGKMFRAGGRIVQGRDAIRELMAPFFEDKTSSLRWSPLTATVSAGGDLGYSYGNWVLKGVDQEGKEVTQYGKYVSIWKKQADGSWKVDIDLGTTGSPNPPDDFKQ